MCTACRLRLNQVRLIEIVIVSVVDDTLKGYDKTATNAVLYCCQVTMARVVE